jgi:hypothetical protein
MDEKYLKEMKKLTILSYVVFYLMLFAFIVSLFVNYYWYTKIYNS